VAVVELNPSGQYASDRNLRARQRLWGCRVPSFDTVGWVLDLARPAPGMRVLDAGCGNGLYLRALRQRQVSAVGCDLSPGMLATVTHPALVTADVTALPFRDSAFDIVLVAQVLDLVPGRRTAIGELRRILAPGGACVVVTTGAQHLRSLREVVERAARTPGWQMRAPTGSAFTLENAAGQLGRAFRDLAQVRPPATAVVITDASIASDYVTSLADHYHAQVARPWPDVARDVRERVQAVIDTQGEFRTAGDLAAIICR
jgi:ubiquinone/menaquinone biosynthesis C-methylase UbiE